ncbi:hypothetical protein FBUS_01726 [Fasciolopsis buskii]|uniref:Uncharacterized protein n=1 Tax=Fasciolopsis buskii TaxID=27845 RepID=A0A8E0RJB9_9TREM|nr:hypothetical protein FBUS_01726 [Fasciolopsis buski]
MKIIGELEVVCPVNWSHHNFHTLANTVKRYLQLIEGDILGRDSGEELLSTLSRPNNQARFEGMYTVTVSQLKPVQQLLALLFGIWFRRIYHTEVNATFAIAVAESALGSVFPSCTTPPRKVERAS